MISVRWILPQSNQRGIETVRSDKSHYEEVQGLNRTSVGLKPETIPARILTESSLNRTSVGLKPCSGSKPSISSSVASIEPAWD